ncbi:MAG: DUF1801 domain-containing protein [Candidatus Zixiibacteriota bacterium]|jgi:uncharacterized protein YdhG (YjbR/CyaY superfamily)
MAGKPKTVDEYLDALDDEKRNALEALRKTVKSAAPAAEEGFAYGVPGFRYKGQVLVTFAAFKGHCGFYPMSPDVIAAFEDELKGYGTSQGTIRFQPADPLPAALVRRIVNARMKEIDAHAA